MTTVEIKPDFFGKLQWSSHPQDNSAVLHFRFLLGLKKKKKTCLIALSRPTEIIEKSQSHFFNFFFKLKIKHF